MKRILLIASLLAVVALGVLNIVYDDRIEPDAVFPMANRFIEWSCAGK